MGSAGELRWEKWLAPAALAVAAAVTLVYVQYAGALVTYPWDWFPDEGLYLDYGRRIVTAPGSLYAHSVSPAPDYYGPVLPLLLAPLAWAARPLVLTRLLGCLWTAAIVAATYALVRRLARPPLAALAASLVLAPAHLSFFFPLVRPDGPMLAFWLWAAVVAAPLSLVRGADHLSWRRALGGALLLAAAVFSKPTAVLHGAPLVLGWLLVDLRSALRLGGLLAGLGAAVVGTLQAASAGGYLANFEFWAMHGRQPGLLWFNLRYFASWSAPILLLALAGLAHALIARRRPWADPTLLLVAGGLAIVPALGKYGALPHYLLPLLCGLVAFAGRCWAGAPPDGAPPARGVSLAGTAVLLAGALVMLEGQASPLPPAGSVSTGRAFYEAVQALVRTGSGPLLALRPEYAYVAVGQPVEIEGSGFKFLLAGGAPGARQVLERLERKFYSVVVLLPMGVTEDEPLAQVLRRQYEELGACDLSYYSGPTAALIMVPRGRAARFDPPPGTRCRAVAGAQRP